MKKILLSLLLFVTPHSPKEDSRVIKIYGPGWTGTAFSVVAPSGRIFLITNAHVCGDQPFLIDIEKGMVVVDPVIKVYPKADLCILSTQKTDGFKVAQNYRFHQKVTVIGYPLGIRKITTGRIRHLVFVPPFQNFYIDLGLRIDHGSSGSPVIDQDGKVIGIVALGSGNPTGPNGFAVPLGFLKDLLRDM